MISFLPQSIRPCLYFVCLFLLFLCLAACDPKVPTAAEESSNFTYQSTSGNSAQNSEQRGKSSREEEGNIDSAFIDITFLGNQGVMIEGDGKRVIIDGLHKGAGTPFWSSLSDDKRVLVENAQYPYDSADVIMVTHNHTDHYSVASVGQYLNCSPSTKLLAINGVRNAMPLYFNYSAILPQIITNVNPQNGQRVATNINGVDIDVLNMHHFVPVCGECGRNYAYLVHFGEITILHLGDVDMLDAENINAFDFSNDDIDVVFLATPFPSFVTTQQRDAMNSWINPAHVVALHMNTNEQATISVLVDNIYPDASKLTEPLSKMRYYKPLTRF